MQTKYLPSSDSMKREQIPGSQTTKDSLQETRHILQLTPDDAILQGF
jgi:hypothetical protein